ncbi:MAG: FAD-dependent oxidoreductase [Melioribacteraceae bacterium]|nr:FAD-dependent oxidoreductase [Melioribacteraceae bacterium]
MEKLAIIGTGIAGMASAYYLKDKYELTIYEKNNYVGGHTNTVTIDEDGEEVNIDTGFMVYNEVTYPNLTNLFKELNVETKNTDMSFSVQHKVSDLEFSGSGLDGLFSQRKNLFSPKYWKMLLQINRFNKECMEVFSDKRYYDYSIREYVEAKKFGNEFLNKYLIPMSSAVWSTPPNKMLDFPAKTLIRFFHNHGFLGLDTQHQWKTVVNGSKSYRDKIIESFKDKITTNNGAIKVGQNGSKIDVIDSNNSKSTFDKVIFACHADEALALLDDPTGLDKMLLSNFKYEKNEVNLHTDSSVMPKTKKAWSSWNYRIDGENEDIKTTTIYYMNSLQGVSENKDYFVSVNGAYLIDPAKIIKSFNYDHPLFDLNAINAQSHLQKLNEQGNYYFCGSYFRYGFHEDALSSAIDLSKKLLEEDVQKISHI